MRSIVLIVVFLFTSIVSTAPWSPTPPYDLPALKSSSFGEPGTDATYDYVIIGGGTAGLAVASRLAEQSNLSVAVIEAGGFYEQDDGNSSVVPAYCVLYAGTDKNDTNPAVDWGFETTPQAGANNRSLHYARGKTLGGSSARNFMVYQRQTVGSAEKWADEVGDSSYTFQNLLPLYKKSVHYNSPASTSLNFPDDSNMQDPSAYSQAGGPLQISFGGYVDPWAVRALPALRELGQAAIDGFNSGKLIGSAYFTSSIDPTQHMIRSSSESTYLRQALKNTNLKVYNRTLAEKIIFTNKKRASAVSVSTNEQNYTLSARKEIILSAGTFQSPQLLMVSGIGPADTLRSLSIPIVKDLPGVGQNLWDHAYYGTDFRVNVTTNSAGLNSAALTAAAVELYQNNASGPLSIATAGILGWEKLPQQLRISLSTETQKALAAFPDDWPEIEYLPVSAALGYQRNFLTEDPRDGYNYASIATALVAPLSRGNITINSTKMSDPPLINPNWITHPADIELAIAAFKRQRTAWAALSDLTIGQEQIPGTSVQTDEQILNFIRQSLAPVWHASSTCKMGKANDSMAVVDSRMRVYGVKGLRIVDASVMPFLPPGHPQATVYALAEKLSKHILAGKKDSP